MGVLLHNLTDRPVHLDLPSGRSVRLPPGASSPSLASADVGGSAMIEKLVGRGVLAVRDDSDSPTSAPSGQRSKARRPGSATPEQQETQ